MGSPCIDDISHAAASMLKRTYQDHPAFERFLSACGQVSGKLKHTLLACLAPPTVRTKARFMMSTACLPGRSGPRALAPAGPSPDRMLAKLRAALLTCCVVKPINKRFQGDAGALLDCQEILKTRVSRPPPWRSANR